MCMIDPDALTLSGLLQDPLTRMVMRSDGVTEEDFARLMRRVQDSLRARCTVPVSHWNVLNEADLASFQHDLARLRSESLGAQNLTASF